MPLSVSAHPLVILRDQSSKAPNSIPETTLSLSVPHHPPATLATAVLLMFTELLKRVYRERCTRQVQSPPTTTRDAAVQSREYLTHQHSSSTRRALYNNIVMSNELQVAGGQLRLKLYRRDRKVSKLSPFFSSAYTLTVMQCMLLLFLCSFSGEVHRLLLYVFKS